MAVDGLLDIVVVMARREAETLIEKLRQMSEEGLSSFFSEVMANEGLRRRFGRAGENFLSNKRSFDRNVESILDFVNLPSKRDFRELKARLDHLNGQLTNLNIKIDRMMAGVSASIADSSTGTRSRKRKS
ncbi:MAG TPA: hypothetical protein VEY94_00425 [Patescibacteria group bacterium]|nr:hypothetical protein [Patescibacteria group bacterium]